MIEGGTTVNSICADCSLLYEYRSETEKGLAFMKKEMESVLESFCAAGHRIETELLGVRPGTGTLDREAFEKWTDRNVSLIRPYVESCRISEGACRLYAEAGRMPADETRTRPACAVRKRSASTDANIPLSRGIFANTIGTAVCGGSHTRKEWMDLASIPAGLGIALTLMEECLQ